MSRRDHRDDGNVVHGIAWAFLLEVLVVLFLIVVFTTLV